LDASSLPKATKAARKLILPLEPEHAHVVPTTLSAGPPGVSSPRSEKKAIAIERSSATTLDLPNARVAVSAARKRWQLPAKRPRSPILDGPNAKAFSFQGLSGGRYAISPQVVQAIVMAIPKSLIPRLRLEEYVTIVKIFTHSTAQTAIFRTG